MSCHVMMRCYAHEQDSGMAPRCQSVVTYVHCSSGLSEAWSLRQLLSCCNQITLTIRTEGTVSGTLVHLRFETVFNEVPHERINQGWFLVDHPMGAISNPPNLQVRDELIETR